MDQIAVNFVDLMHTEIGLTRSYAHTQCNFATSYLLKKPFHKLLILIINVQFYLIN